MNIIDITNSINLAISQNVLWSISEFHFAVETLVTAGMEILHEEEENWATIRLNDSSVGYLWRKYPLLICEGRVSEIIYSALSDFPFIVFIRSETLDTSCFVMDQSKMPNVIDFRFENRVFSGNDFWFHTVQE